MSRTTPKSSSDPLARPDLLSPRDLNALIASSPPLVPGATRAVLGEGPLGAEIALVGEQPGDREDIEGRPFVGPAGHVLDRALGAAGIDRGRCYVTNAVKHFKFVERGKRRLHQKPTAGEIRHYRWWLMAEIDFVAPRIVVALGATALHALTGKALPIAPNRGETNFANRRGYVTVHPSSILRLRTPPERDSAFQGFAADMRRVAELAHRT